MRIVDKVASIASSRHTGRAMKFAKVLNAIGTIRGAVTTVLLGASVIGGALTVNTVRQDIAQASAEPRHAATPRPTATAAPTVNVRADAEKRLQTALANNAQALDDLRKVAVIPGPRLDQLIDEGKQKLQARYELALAQIGELYGASPSPGRSGSPAPSPGAVAVNAIVQVAQGDMNTIVVIATRAATTEPTARPTASPTASPTPTPVPTRPPTPVPTRSPVPPTTTPRASPTR